MFQYNNIRLHSLDTPQFILVTCKYAFVGVWIFWLLKKKKYPRTWSKLYRDLDAPQLSSYLTVHLKGDFCGYGHHGLGSAEGTRHYALARSGTVHTQVFLHAIIFILAVSRQDHNHLTHTHTIYKISAIEYPFVLSQVMEHLYTAAVTPVPYSPWSNNCHCL